MDLLSVRYAKVLMLNRNVSDLNTPNNNSSSLKVEVTSPSLINRTMEVAVSIMASGKQSKRQPLKTMTLKNMEMIGVATVTVLNIVVVLLVTLRANPLAVPSQTFPQSKRWIGLRTIENSLNNADPKLGSVVAGSIKTTW